MEEELTKATPKIIPTIMKLNSEESKGGDLTSIILSAFNIEQAS